jgi:hypothetical protein
MPRYEDPRVIEVIEHYDDGSKRHGTVTRRRSNTSMSQWSGALVHPTERFEIAGYGNGMDRLREAMDLKEPRFQESRARGHRPHSNMLPDHNVRIDDAGNSMRADVTMNMRDFRYGRR